MKPKRRAATGALAGGAALGVAASADAVPFDVTSTGDSGPGTLRQALLDANATAGPDTITFDAALGGSTITLTTGELLISDSVEIQGLGSASLAVDANDASRVFSVYSPSPTPIDVTISGLTLAHGRSVVVGDPVASAGGAVSVIGENLVLDDVDIVDSIAGGSGGGLSFLGVENTSSYNPVAASLTIQSSRISGNTADFVDPGVPVDQGGSGGGVYAAGIYSVVLDDVELIGNQARAGGGGFAGVYLQDGGTVTIQSSLITGNTAGLGGGGSGGGGVSLFGYDFAGESSATIADSTISGNDGNSYGGGVSVGYLSGTTVARSTISGNVADYGGGLTTVFAVSTLENSTVAENTANARGGGIYSYYSYLTLEETTISGNTAADGAPGIYAYGASEIGIVNSIVADNGAGPDLVDDGESFFGVSYSLVEAPGAAQISDGGGNVFDQDPQLGPLQDNGGPTLTTKPAGTSPAVDAGDPAFTPPPSTDQRGFARVVGGRIDMGAVELAPGTVQFSVVAQNVNEDAGTASVTVTRTGGSDGAVSVEVAVSGASTATGGGVDYTFAGATASFADGDAAPQTFDIAITDDAEVEVAETIALALEGASGAAIGTPATHTVTIIDNDFEADLSITKSLVPGPVTQGENVTFDLTVQNDGPHPALSVVVTDTLPPQLGLVAATPSTGSCSGTTTITCNLGTLLPTESATITIVATLTGIGPTTNVATVASDTADDDPINNSGQVTFTILPAPETVPIPTLEPFLQLVLAAILAVAALGRIGRR